MKNNKPTVKKAFVNATKNFLSIAPLIVGIIGLVGLFQVYVSAEMLSKFFGYGAFSDTLIGTLIGAISSGNASISFVIAQGLQDQGITIYAISSFVLAWVTLSFVHLYAEVEVFGKKFTVYRNILVFFSTIFITYLTVATVGLF